MPRKTLYIQPTKAAIAAAKKGLEARKKAPKSKKGGLDTQQAKAEGVGSGVARARDIIAGKKVNAYQVKAFFDRHRQNYLNAKMKGLRPEESKAIQAWLIWGGEPLRKQVEREVAKHQKTMRNPDSGQYTIEIFRGRHAGTTRTYKTLKGARRACDKLDLEYGAICCRLVRSKVESKNPNKEPPTAKALVTKCQKLWEAYCKKPGVTKLRAVAKHCEAMKASTAKSVKEEQGRCMRSVRAEAKARGWKL